MLSMDEGLIVTLPTEYLDAARIEKSPGSDTVIYPVNIHVDSVFEVVQTAVPPIVFSAVILSVRTAVALVTAN